MVYKKDTFGYLFLYHGREPWTHSLIKSQVFSPAELSDVGSSPRPPLPVADEGGRGESPRSKEKRVPLAGACFDSGTASVIDVMFRLKFIQIETTIQHHLTPKKGVKKVSRLLGAVQKRYSS